MYLGPIYESYIELVNIMVTEYTVVNFFLLVQSHCRITL